MQNKIFLPFAIALFFTFRMMFKRAVIYHAGRKEWITDKRWYHYAMYYALMAFFTGVLLIPFFPETVMQIGRFYDLHHGKKFADIEVKRTMFFNIIYDHYYWTRLLDN
ncbi:MAG: hypothetical protein K2O65_01880 [Lachnospiraceae bacterium]|nr:hypothetical protein [Lachnospiraceae bacterium]